jgi:hypothetical protein
MKYPLLGLPVTIKKCIGNSSLPNEKYTTKEVFVKYFQRLLHRWKINTEREGDMFKTEQGLFTVFSNNFYGKILLTFLYNIQKWQGIRPGE